MKKFLTLVLCLFSIACRQEVSLDGSYRLTNAPQEAEITLVIEGNHFAGQSAINRYFGTLTRHGTHISFAVAGATMMAGPEDLMKTEQAYLQDLPKVDTFQLDNTTLTLSGNGLSNFVFEKTEN